MKNFLKYIMLPSCIVVVIVMLIVLYDPEGAKREREQRTIVLYEEVVCIVVKFDGCEYIENSYYDVGYNKRTILTHKGNCNNPIHYKAEK